jgi:hypothetical protein
MHDKKFNVNDLRIASPCSVGWESMTGDERKRHCDMCHRSVYNISALTSVEVERLIGAGTAQVCIRMFRRADGTVLTRDCPVGLRAARQRVARFAGATLAAFLGLFSVTFGQKEDKGSIDAAKANITRTISQRYEADVSGAVKDAGAVIPSVELNLYQKGKKTPIKVKADEDGNYVFKLLAAGVYDLEAKSKGFKTRKITGIRIDNNESLLLNIQLAAHGVTVTVGMAFPPLIDTTSSTITTTITSEMMDRLPH